MTDVVLPCLDEAPALAWLLGRMPSGYRPIVADNGSTDGSPELARELGARVVSVAERGYGAALMGGIAASRGRYVLMADADASYDLAEIPKFLAALRAGADL
ncbi:MAG TPA: glycosyltransferase family 2 protein, partial [Actinoplanes sp.]|nr:glycosyltransferase family 2 protein [Actinoplanes sp.]